MSSTAQLQLDRAATSEKEAQIFENKDDTLSRDKMAHELESLKIKQGFVGKVIGSSDAGINFAFTLTMFLGVVILLSFLGMFWSTQHSAISQDIIRFSITGVLTIAGYVFGKKS